MRHEWIGDGEISYCVDSSLRGFSGDMEVAFGARELIKEILRLAEENAALRKQVSGWQAVVARQESDMAADAREDGEKRATIAVLEAALKEAYWLTHHAWDTQRFGAYNADEAKDLRREMAGVLTRAGVQNPAHPDNPDIPLPWAEDKKLRANHVALEAENRRLRILTLAIREDLAAFEKRFSTAWNLLHPTAPPSSEAPDCPGGSPPGLSGAESPPSDPSGLPPGCSPG